MLVVINGDERRIEPDTTVAGLLRDREAEPRKVAVEVNRELVTRVAFADTVLQDGDRIEIVTFVGGG